MRAFGYYVTIKILKMGSTLKQEADEVDGYEVEKNFLTQPCRLTNVIPLTKAGQHRSRYPQDIS